ncbi:MAG: MucB/RseB C-terminal domain-containing protein [Tepidiphilus sp.]|jgi:sigma-E factor negative regulatory protein RseB|nr:MucB/RseB C-terminal domain-containing protein [Tepidiphilus sp.]MDD3432621.1 MucB/RseB C-terminal domain-containing protein [Tepidiphilus sp.]
MHFAAKVRFTVCLLMAGISALANASEDVLRLLERALSPPDIDYHGTVVLQIGDRVKTMRITHMNDGGERFEWVEVLEGEPRETVRIGEEVRCFLPEEKLVLLDQATGASGLPSHRLGTVGRIAASYRLEPLGEGRVAGREAVGIRFVPHDALRFGQEWWIDRESGVVLKRTIWDEAPARVLETQIFSDFRMTGVPDATQVRRKFAAHEDWRRIDLRGRRVEAADTGWAFTAMPAGFELEAVLQRRGPSGKTITQWQLGDGLVSVSVFFEPWDGDEVGEKTDHFGATTVMRRREPGALRTAMGEVPDVTLRALLDAMVRHQGAQ